ncbi:MAG: hypothetical protein JOZ99_00800, partial [Actinobacteria bacterium]|nr:hypothetical protein [Actinomycetota bacterium]
MLTAGLLAACVPPAPPTGNGRQPNPVFCNKVKSNSIVVSQGAQMYCFGPQGMHAAARPNGPGANAPTVTPTNVAASNLTEDVAPNGLRGYGQEETSLAVNGSYVVEAWNDATGFFSPCGSPQYKEELTGFGFSADGGKTFLDMGGLPNNTCGGPNGYFYGGDPSVETATIGGVSYFYISSLFNANAFSSGTLSKVAMSVCAATGTGATANLACGQPVIVAQSSECSTMFGFTACSFLDKDFLTVDPVHQRLYLTYTEFGAFTPLNTINLAVCDISNPTLPQCSNGRAGNGATPQPSYLVVAPTSPNFCESEGSYPAVDTGTGDVYVAYESNVGGGCGFDPVRQIVNRIPFGNLSLPNRSGGVTNLTAIDVTSMSAAIIAGYNRNPNDFPRIAVSRPAGTVSIVWNDARFHPLGDILLQSWRLGSLTPVGGPIQLDTPTGGLHLMPALRNADNTGLLDVT